MQSAGETYGSFFRWKRLHRDNSFLLRDGTVTLVGHRVYYFGLLRDKDFGGVFSLKSFTWQSFETGMDGRYNHATAFAEDKIYHYGGKTSTLAYTDELVEFDMITEKARFIVGNGGGRRTGAGSKSPGRRGSMSAVWVPWRREVIFFGGIKPAGTERRCNDTFGFNVDRSSWKEIAMTGSLPTPRTGHSALVYGTKMYVYGGFTSRTEYLGDLQIADFSQDRRPSWSTPKLQGIPPKGRTVTAFQILGDRFVCYGGYSNRAAVRLDLIVFNPRTNQWSTLRDQVYVKGRHPNDTTNHLGVETFDGIVYFTHPGIFKLELDS